MAWIGILQARSGCTLPDKQDRAGSRVQLAHVLFLRWIFWDDGIRKCDACRGPTSRLGSASSKSELFLHGPIKQQRKKTEFQHAMFLQHSRL